MNKIQQFFKWLLTPKEKEYIYFRNTKRHYYGLCGIETTYEKIKYPTGCTPTLDYMCLILASNKRGYYECTKSEYERYMINKETK